MTNELIIAGPEGIFTWGISRVAETVGKGATDTGAALWRDLEQNKAARAYVAKMKKRYGSIQILGQHEPKPLTEIFTDAYIHDRPTYDYVESVDQLLEAHQQSSRLSRHGKRINALAFAKKTERLFVLGKPGAGKTTFMKYLTMQGVEEKTDYIPIFVSLNELAQQGKSIIGYMVEQFKVCDFPDTEPFIDKLLQGGKAIILFDGLDEVAKEENKRRKLTRDLHQFIDQYDQARYVITCRIAASDYTFPEFSYVEMADFTDEQVEKLVVRWFADQPSKRDRFLADLEKDEHKGAREMTTSPLLLTMLCLQYNSTMAFLPSRAEMYEKALTVLLTDWDSTRGIQRNEAVIEQEDRYRALSPKRKIELISRLAYETFSNGELFIPQKWLEDKIAHHLGTMPNMPAHTEIDGRLILKTIESQHGLLVERASRIYSYSHLTFQEYFAARYIVDHQHEPGRQPNKTVLEELITAERIADERWREVFLFVAELLPKANRFAELFVQALREVAVSRVAVQTLVQWAMQRSVENQLTRQPTDSRLGYLILALDLDFERIFGSDLISDLILDPDRARAFDLALDLDDPDHALDLALDLDVDLALDLVHEIVHEIVIEIDLYRQYKYVRIMFTTSVFVYILALTDRVQKLATETNWSELNDAILALTFPKEESPAEEWSEFTSQIEQIQIGVICQGWRWEVEDDVDCDVFKSWLKGHRLLKDCLERAVLYGVTLEEFANEYFFTLPDEGEGDAAAPQSYTLPILRRKIARLFDDGELRSLCFDLEVTYDHLNGRNTKEKARELVAHIDKQGQIDELVELCRAEYPAEFP